MYEVDQELLGVGSESLLEKAQWSWRIFDDELGERTQGRLLEDILNCRWDDDDGESPVCADDLYTFAGGPLHLTEAQAWSEFCASVRENPNENLAFEDQVVEDILNSVEGVANAGATFYRARLGSKVVNYQEQPYSGGEMGAPPVDKTTDGRANKKGQRVLYCAEEENTAVAEVRPARGMAVSVCRMMLLRDARLLDLCRERSGINPFVSPYPAYEVEIAHLLQSFAQEMSEPLRHGDDPTHYLPVPAALRVLCRFGFRRCGVSRAHFVKMARIWSFSIQILPLLSGHDW